MKTKVSPILATAFAILLANAIAQEPKRSPTSRLGTGRETADAVTGRSGEQPLQGESELRKRISGFFTQIQGGKVDEAYATLLEKSPIKENKADLVTRTNSVIKTSGRFTSNEIVKTHRLGTRLIKFSWFSHGDLFPLQWDFYYYKGKSMWQLMDIQVTNDLQLMFR